jgi:glycosyltransferase involved in cell wall biosynthesis
LKIAHIITRLDLGGSSENTLLTALGLAKMGHEVSIVCGMSENPPSENEVKAASAGIGIIRLPTFIRDISPLKDLATLAKLYRILRRGGFDLVHTHTSKAGILGRVAARWAGIRCIVHTPHGHIFYGYFSRPLSRFFIFLEWLTMFRTDALVTLTKREKEDYLNVGIGPASRIHPIFSGIELAPLLSAGDERAAIRAGFGLEESHFVCGTVARLVEVKNHSAIIHAAAQLKAHAAGLRFVFIGDGELRPALEALAQAEGVSGMFIFTGWRRDIPALLSAFDAFVMVSLNEGMGRAFVEAQAAGLPVIGSRVGGIPEVLIEDETGFLVDPNDSTTLAHFIERLYTDKGTLDRMAAACRSWVYPRFSDGVMVNAIETLYCGILAAKAKKRRRGDGEGEN